MSKEHGDMTAGDAGRTEKRTPPSIRFHDPEWARIEALAEARELQDEVRK